MIQGTGSPGEKTRVHAPTTVGSVKDLDIVDF
jgi:hypothetical protein